MIMLFSIGPSVTATSPRPVRPLSQAGTASSVETSPRISTAETSGETATGIFTSTSTAVLNVDAAAAAVLGEAQQPVYQMLSMEELVLKTVKEKESIFEYHAIKTHVFFQNALNW